MILSLRTLLFACLALFLTAGICLLVLSWPAESADKPAPAKLRPVITVEAAYPGANAAVVADTVAAPIEQQVNGVAKMVHLSSRCANDGSYTLDIVFEPGVEVDEAQKLVQARVDLALPTLPEETKRQGVTVKKKSVGPILFVGLFSPDDSRDTLYLSNYAALHLRGELSRLPGVGDITGLGQADSRLRIWLDPEKLTSHGLTAADVTRALEQQKLQVAAGQVGQPPVPKGQEFALAVNPLGRLADVEQFENLTLKTTTEGRAIRLRDVARIEVGGDPAHGPARLNGKPAVVLAISATVQARPKELHAALGEKLGQLRARLPKGVAIDYTFAFAPNLDAPDRPATSEYLLLDLDLPAGASAERTLAALKQVEALLRDEKEIQNVLALLEHPFDRSRDRPCLLVRLIPADKRQASREQLVRALRTRLEQVPGVALRWRDVSAPGRFPGWGYPIDLAVHGPEADQVRELAQKLAERLRKEKKLTDLWLDPASTPQPQLCVDIDRARAKVQGVAMEDVFRALQTYFGQQQINDFNRFGRTWQVVVQMEAANPRKAEGLKQLKVRNSKEEMVPLSNLVTVRELTGVAALHRFNGRPMEEITAHPAPGVSLAEARGLCEKLAEEIRKELRLSAEYRLTWFQDPP